MTIFEAVQQLGKSMAEYILECELTQDEMNLLSDFCQRSFNSKQRAFRMFAAQDLRDLTLDELREEVVEIGIERPELRLNVPDAIVAFTLLRKMKQDKLGHEVGRSELLIRTQFTRLEVDAFLNAVQPANDNPQ